VQRLRLPRLGTSEWPYNSVLGTESQQPLMNMSHDCAGRPHINICSRGAKNISTDYRNRSNEQKFILKREQISFTNTEQRKPSILRLLKLYSRVNNNDGVSAIFFPSPLTQKSHAPLCTILNLINASVLPLVVAVAVSTNTVCYRGPGLHQHPALTHALARLLTSSSRL
jgi:hypothetical protein